MTQQFIDAIRDHGLNPPAQIPPGEFVRFPGRDKKNGNKAGWARLFPDCLGGVFGDYSTGLSETWQSEKAKTYTESQRIDFDNMIKEQQVKAQALKDNEQAEAARQAQETWETLQPANNNHPYLLAKKIKSYNLRIMGDLLVMPIYSPDNEITTYQTIAPDGSKRLHKGGKKQGCAFIIHGHGDRLYIVEGYATGASVHEATGSTVLVAIDAGNLLPVVESISWDKHKNIIIAADNDHGKERNTGIDAAKTINKKYNEIEYIVPPSLPGRVDTDWNDYVNEKGIDKAREILIHREEVLTSDDIQTDNLTLHIPKKYYENPLIELGLKASAEISALSILQYALPSVVAHIATALAGKIRYKSVHPSFFFIRIGPTSTGKTFVDKSFKDLLYSKFDSIQPRRDNKPPDVVNTFYGPTDIASGPGFARAIQNHPRCLMIVDEGTYLISSGTQSGGKRSENTQSKVKYILELSTGAGGIAEIAHSDSEKDKSIRGAVVNLIGNGTKIMLNELSVADIENGLIQRLDFWAYDGMEPYWNMDAGETDECQRLCGKVERASQLRKARRVL
jgi:putative DNA primase/helicase